MSAHIADFEPVASTARKRGPSRSRSKGRSYGGITFGIGACALLLGGLIWTAQDAPQPPSPRQRPPLAPTSPWADIARPIPLIDLASPLVGVGPPRYEAWRATSGEGRKDALTFGSFEKEGRFFRLVIEQRTPASPTEPFYSDLARQAALAGLFVERAETPLPQPSKFGALSVADATLASGVLRRSCLLFRSDDPTVRLSGIGCGDAHDPFGRASLACALDRVDIIGGGADAPTTKFFEQAELSRGRGCKSQQRAPGRTHATWLDPGAPMPRLKTNAIAATRAARAPAAKDL